jgi:hypothetical protein
VVVELLLRRGMAAAAVTLGLSVALGACSAPTATQTGARNWPAGKPLEMAIIVPRGADPAPDARGPNGEPYCRNVGGYEAYYKRTGNACFLGPDNYLDIGYWETGDAIKP